MIISIITVIIILMVPISNSIAEMQERKKHGKN